MGMGRVGGYLKHRALFGPDSVLTHQTGYALSAVAHAIGRKLTVYAGAAVDVVHWR